MSEASCNTVIGYPSTPLGAHMVIDGIVSHCLCCSGLFGCRHGGHAKCGRALPVRWFLCCSEGCRALELRYAPLPCQASLQAMLTQGLQVARLMMHATPAFAAGVLVLQPSTEVFEDMMARISSTHSYTGGDQGFLNAYFSEFAGSPLFEPRAGKLLSDSVMKKFSRVGTPVSCMLRSMTP
jgi:hypothetical protein